MELMLNQQVSEGELAIAQQEQEQVPFLSNTTTDLSLVV